ncbi:Basic leucine zipper transcriptional factor ATF-like 2 [Galemys pyrenaicus]|uniref:Basic leucine zipper transcriptional factor ATF-like 2 n=1 Tax=Galemys pyrenaicus TaxID=202257 RepID=A0A8J6AV16_GALPY|nr:Basic leucine zipper transcriptional factor ATF-like 2 [Galemys pyrenaicus]
MRRWAHLSLDVGSYGRRQEDASTNEQQQQRNESSRTREKKQSGEGGWPLRLCLSPQDPLEQQKQLRKKQKNRAAAQRSRQKHTDKADALHQQHESLEKHNSALRKEIQALQDELAWWSRALSAHERLCPLDGAPGPAPEPSGSWGQAEPSPGARTQDRQEQPGLLPAPVPSPLAQQLSPDPLRPHSPAGLLLCPPAPVPFGPAAAAAPAAQEPPSPAQEASPPDSSLLSPSSKLSSLLSGLPAHLAPAQPLGQQHPASLKLGTLPHCPLAPRGQAGDHKSAVWASDLQGLEPGPHPLLAFPLLASARVHF